MRIMLTGGGTGGATVPLLAIAEEFLARGIFSKEDFFYLGTKTGPERKMVEEFGIPFRSIFSGKLRRYASFWLLVDPLFLVLGFFQSLWFIFVKRPEVVLSVGGFVSVPVVWAAWIFRKKILIHQQDIRTGLANRLMTPFANRVTVSFEKSLQDFPKEKTVFTGNAVRKSIEAGSREKAKEIFHLEENVPLILVTGGGTGSERINMLLKNSLDELLQFSQIIHLTGKNRGSIENIVNPRYHSYEMLTSELKHAFTASDVVVSRAGLSTLSELSILGKPSIIIPISHSHQEENAHYFFSKHAVKVLEEKKVTPDEFVQTIRELVFEENMRKSLSENIKKIMPQNGREKIVEEIINLCHPESRVSGMKDLGRRPH